jgi:glutathione S-transferase
MIVLHHDWDAFCCIKVRFCLAEKGVDFVSRIVDLQRMEQLTPEYLAINPNGVVPTLMDRGRAVFESSVINEYIDESFSGPRLMPLDAHGRAIARLWVKFEDDVLHPAVKGPTYRYMLSQSLGRLPREVIEARIARAPTPQKAEFLRKALIDKAPNEDDGLAAVSAVFTRAIDKMERRLSEARWFGGEQFSLADVAIAPFIDRLEELQFANLWANRPALSRWIASIKARPAYRAALPKDEQRIPAPLMENA